MDTLLDDCLRRADAIKSTGASPLAVFDLDGTLFDNGPRTISILRTFAERHGHSTLAKKLVNFEISAYSIMETLDQLDVSDPDLRDDIFASWKEHFFTDDAQMLDKPLAGAVDLVNKLHRSGTTIIYLTGRDAKNMGAGCFAALRKSGFPVGVCYTTMLLKPTFEEDDLEFKREAVAFINTMGTVLASFDNEPGNCNLFHQTWPGALVALCDTQHHPGAPALDSDIGRFKDFTGGLS